jgi:hypothetical protein
MPGMLIVLQCLHHPHTVKVVKRDEQYSHMYEVSDKGPTWSRHMYIISLGQAESDDNPDV